MGAARVVVLAFAGVTRVASAYSFCSVADAPVARRFPARQVHIAAQCGVHSASSSDSTLGVLLSAAKAQDRSFVDSAFDGISHATMKQINDMAGEGNAEAAWLLKCMEDVMEKRLEDGAEKLRRVLQAGEINKMDAELVKLVRGGEVDTGFNLVLASNIQHARASEDDTMLQLYTHLSTRVQEELEKQASPALGLLHRLLRTDDEELRARIIVDFMVPKQAVVLPSGEQVPLGKPVPPKVTPVEFAEVVRDTITAVASVDLGAGDTGVDPVADYVESCRQVAKVARVVIADNLDTSALDEFSELLGPVCAFARAAVLGPSMGWRRGRRLPHPLSARSRPLAENTGDLRVRTHALPDELPRARGHRDVWAS